MSRPRVAALAAAAVLAVGVLGAIGWPASAYRNGDFVQFWVQPQALLEGGDPYDAGWWSAAHARAGQHPENPQAVYPPHDAIAFLPFALLPFPYAGAAWIVAQLLAVGAAVLVLGARIPRRADRSVFVALAVGFQPLWLLAVGANMAGFLFAALALAFDAALDRRMLRCGALLGLLVVKPHPFAFLALALLVLASWRERRALAAGALATAGTLVAVTLALRPSWYGEWIASAVDLAGSPRSNSTAWTLDRVAGLPAASGPFVAAAAILAFAVWAYRRRPGVPGAIAAGIPVSLAVAPYGWSYDQLVLLVPVAVGVAAIGGLRERPRIAGLVLLVVTVTLVPWLLYALAFRRGGEELSVSTPLLVFAFVVAALARTRVTPAMRL